LARRSKNFNRRGLLIGFAVTGGAIGLGGCTNSTTSRQPNQLDPAYVRTVVPYDTREPPGTIVVDPPNHFLYVVQKGGQAVRYGVGVGREGFSWSGVATIQAKREWPDWYPPKEMVERRPELRQAMTEVERGMGMPAGLGNPLGARALYLWKGNKDTLYRIHGTNEPWTIGQNVSSGCIRLTNEDVIDLYGRTPVGTRVVVLASP
jgi:lipoprotein-anchoring transpeptidase ErfK/SrfK